MNARLIQDDAVLMVIAATDWALSFAPAKLVTVGMRIPV